MLASHRSTSCHWYCPAWRALPTPSAPRPSAASSCDDYWGRGLWPHHDGPVRQAYVRQRACAVPFPSCAELTSLQVLDIVHSNGRNLTVTCGYTRLDGLPDGSRTDPQDHAWFGPHDRLLTEESESLDFVGGTSHGELFLLFKICGLCGAMAASRSIICAH